MVNFLILLVVLAIVFGGPAILIYNLKNKRCRYCRVYAKKVKDLPEDLRVQAQKVIKSEEMPQNPSEYDVCPECLRIYDWKWFDDERVYKRDGDLYDRQCACGFDLKPPWHVREEILKKALDAINPSDYKELCSEHGDPKSSAAYYNRLADDNILFICLKCQRVYTWKHIGIFKVLQCISSAHSKYDSRS